MRALRRAEQTYQQLRRGEATDEDDVNQDDVDQDDQDDQDLPGRPAGGG